MRTDTVTHELPGLPALPAKRGRKPKADKMTNAERQKAYRSRRVLIEAGEAMPATVARLAEQFGYTEAQITRELIRFALCSRNWSKMGFPGLE